MKSIKKNVLISILAGFFAIVIFLGGFVLGIDFSKSGIAQVDFFNQFLGKNTSAQSLITQTNENSLESVEVKTIKKALDFITANSISKKTKQELTSAAIKGMLEILDDKYADYFSPQQYKQIIESYSGTMSGIGVVVTLNDKDEVLVINVIEGTPAYNAGIVQGDIITAVNGIDIKGKSLDEVVSMIKGEENTEVNITVYRASENKKYSFTIIRKKFYVPNFYLNVIDDNILYIQYADFQEEGASKLNEKIGQIINEADKNTKIQGIIVDLRNNLGGTLNDAVNFCDLFLESGVIVTVKGRTNNQDIVEEFKAKPGGYINIPMIVLINNYSASAAELSAGALKDLGRAVLVGEKSFGKGTVQVLNDLPDGSGIKFTTAKYYLPSGVSIDGTGITPDIYVALTRDDKEDVQLKKALEEIKKMIENQSKK